MTRRHCVCLAQEYDDRLGPRVTLQAQFRNLARRLLLARGQEEHELGFGREFVTEPGPGLAVPGP